MYLPSISLVYIKPCTTGGGRIKFRAKLTHPVPEVMPYLNTVIKTGLYIPSAKTFTYKIGSHIINIANDRLTCTQLTNESQCYEMIDHIHELINETWENRANITPNEETRERPSAIQLYKLLPKKVGCKVCGQGSCMAFASKLILGTCRLHQCTLMKEEEYAPNYLSLEAHLQLLGYETDEA
nr:(Fe-S)-binding protein [uncultured Acetobacterium sp.]